MKVWPGRCPALDYARIATFAYLSSIIIGASEFARVADNWLIGRFAVTCGKFRMSLDRQGEFQDSRFREHKSGSRRQIFSLAQSSDFSARPSCGRDWKEHKVPRWLKELDLSVPDEEVIDPKMGYASDSLNLALTLMPIGGRPRSRRLHRTHVQPGFGR